MAETSITPAPSWPSSSGDEREPMVLEAPPPSVDSSDEPMFGTMSVSGRSREMEDAISVRTRLCRPDTNLRRPVHFFAAYDGHGGAHVATLCRENLHMLVEEELMRVRYRAGSTEREDGWRSVMERSFQRMDDMAICTCACGIAGYQCESHSMDVALSGSTAVVAVLTQEHIIVANCGDSRAILCRAGGAIPLSSDHKPDRPDELARIKAAGGRVIFMNGARVEGILAMSRAIGDKYLKPVVTSEPEMTYTRRDPEDECLILASDGLWDAVTNNLACEVACECLGEGNRGAAAVIDPNANAEPPIEGEGAGELYQSRSVMAAALLTRLALGRKSADNISVIVVDLKRTQE